MQNFRYLYNRAVIVNPNVAIISVSYLCTRMGNSSLNMTYRPYRPYRSCRICILEDLEFANFVYCLIPQSQKYQVKKNELENTSNHNESYCLFCFFFYRRGDPSECPSMQESRSPCKDRGSKSLCRSYKRRNMCNRYQSYLSKKCKKSCGFC